ncbi:alpha/beta hydrolase [Halobacteriales archaeon SW_7_68_16]|nr:MAG: alpha/beta hydrolase [Halobacteriales archaeon SW_7_68_16]
MRLRKPLAAIAGGLGVAAVGNRLLASRADETLAAPLPGETGTYRWRGIDVTYTEAGDPEDPDVLLLHGINAAATSYEFDGIAETLAESYHVIAPDLPGYGRSARPPLVYDADLYTDFVADFAADTTEDAVCIASSLTAAYAVGATEPAGFSRLVSICPTATGMPGQRTLLRTLYRAPLVGAALHNLIVSRPSLRYFSADHGYYDPAAITDEKIDYQWEAGHQPGSRFAPASFLAGDLNTEVDLGAALADLDVPVTLIWGREAELTPLSEGRDLADRAGARLVVVDYADLLPHAEHPEQFLAGIAADLPDLDLDDDVPASARL